MDKGTNIKLFFDGSDVNRYNFSIHYEGKEVAIFLWYVAMASNTLGLNGFDIQDTKFSATSDGTVIHITCFGDAFGDDCTQLVQMFNDKWAEITQ